MDFIKEKEQIIKEILKSKKVKPGDSIDYTQFLELYAPYKDMMREIEFAKIIEINYDNYWKLKNIKGRRVKILKSMQKEAEEKEKQRIVEEILSSGKVKLGDSIDYAQFLELYVSYENRMKERKFAKILEITDDNYESMKYHRNKSKNIKWLCTNEISR